MKKLIVAGGRNYRVSREDINHLHCLVAQEDYKSIVSGCASGADFAGEIYAHCFDMKVYYFPAQWETNGRAAGPIRNEEMAKFADGLAVFDGGAGTRDMVRRAKKHGIPIHDFRTQV